MQATALKRPTLSTNSLLHRSPSNLPPPPTTGAQCTRALALRARMMRWWMELLLLLFSKRSVPSQSVYAYFIRYFHRHARQYKYSRWARVYPISADILKCISVWIYVYVFVETRRYPAMYNLATTDNNWALCMLVPYTRAHIRNTADTAARVCLAPANAEHSVAEIYLFEVGLEILE